MFWELIDEILNAVLFVLIGMEVLLIAFTRPLLVAGAAAIVVVVVVARTLTVGLPVRLGPRFFGLPRGSAQVLTWAGLRGGISVALALSLPAGGGRRAQRRAGINVLRGGVLDSGAGPEHWPCGAFQYAPARG